MRDIIYSICVLIALVIGLFLGSVITERRVASYLDGETDKIDRAEERAEKAPEIKVASIRPGTVWVEASEYDRIMSRRVR